MKYSKTTLGGVLIIEPKIIEDNRGFFMECYVERELIEINIETRFVQDNHSLSKAKGTVRGLHYQLPPKAQSKLVRVVRGAIVNIVVDIRQGSPTFGKWLGVELSADNRRQLYIPKGFANGYCTLEPDTEVCYKVDEYYAPEQDRAILWNDEDLGIDWPVDDPVLSARDRSAPSFKQAENDFRYEES
jgi:dTDP-4-dehydrorhamnose 3,5-epimerase